MINIMKKKKQPADLNKLASSIVGMATDTETGDDENDNKNINKNQAAVELGRLGGLKGGKARANKLTPERRKAIAKKAAAARWNKK